MKKHSKTIAVLILGTLLGTSLIGCGSSASTQSASTESTSAESISTESASTESTSTIEASSEALAGDGYDESVDYASLAGTTITVAASPTPHAEILTVAAEILAEADITLDIREYDDYVQPNEVVESGDINANYFQHVPYLDDFNAENGTHLVSVAGIHVEPMGIYAGKSDSLDAFTDGAEIAVPNDTINESRALLLLEKQGIIKLADGAGISATKNDIVENPYNIEIVEVEAAQVPRVLQDVDFAVINSNYAIEAGFNPTADSLAIEGSDSEYVNVLVVLEGNEETDQTKVLIAALQSEKVREFIESTYDGAVVPVF